MEVDMSLALDIALELIFLDDLIEDRHTLLTGRLVCRAWRTSKTFYSKITSVTLYTPADVQLAADLFSHTPRQHSPWRSAEEGAAFPSLNMLTVSEALKSHLWESSTSRDLLASIDKVDVHIELEEEETESELRGHLVATAATSLKYETESEGLQSLLDAANLTTFTRLSQLTISCDPLPIHSLSTFKSLRHLRVTDLTLASERELHDCIAAFASLTQLTRLDIVNLFLSCFPRDLHDIRDLVNNLAPGVLHDLQLWFDPNEFDECSLRAFVNLGVFEIESCRCIINIRAPEELNWKVSQQLSLYSGYAASSQELKIYLKCAIPDKRIPIDLTHAASVRNLGVDVCKMGYVVEPAEWSAVPRASFAQPVFTTKHGVAMAATSLEFVTSRLGPIDLTPLALALPSLFPHLQRLSLSAGNGIYDYPDSFCHLTKLTHLTMSSRFSDAAQFPLVPTVFPPSVRELVVEFDQLEFAGLSGLEHLTLLSFQRRNQIGDSTLHSLYSCRAPLRDLTVHGWPVDLQAIAESFPHLETLSVDLSTFDVSSVSSLQSLWKLRVELPKSETAVLTGIGSLTALLSLTVVTPSNCMDGLLNLAVLTQLRQLDCVLRVWSMPDYSSLANGFHKHRKELQQSMPHTRIGLRVDYVDKFFCIG